MCGIFCALSGSHAILPNDELMQRLRNRGPDSNNTLRLKYSWTSPPEHYQLTQCVQISFYSTVLSLRGSQTVTQPYQDLKGKYTLCWNGEAWSIGGKPTSGNDTEAVHSLLANALESSSNGDDALTDLTESAERIAKALSQVSGPYAFVFFDQLRGRVFFGRDFLGRRSLLRSTTQNGDLLISSVSGGQRDDAWTEIEPDGVYYVDLRATDDVGIDDSPSSSAQSRICGRFVAVTAPYNFAQEGQAEPRIPDSVIPRLSLNKQVPSSRETLYEDSPAVAILRSLLKESLSLRILNIPEPPANGTKQRALDRAKLAILFSGGLDCTVLARISHNLLPLSEPIDLLNVAFENPRIHKSYDTPAYELCPDRISGRSSCTELQRICPGREWRFVAINVPYAETIAHRETVVSLMQPHNTEMDLSISCALYFAARGQGEIPTSLRSEPVPYTTRARVLLSGLGADELFGGYTRHGTAFKHRGLNGLLDELELDVSRLGKRNLGRDDRVMSHWSKEVRFPYLDETLLSWALNVPVNEKCGFGESGVDCSTLDDNGSSALEPGKKILRCLAWKLGMKDVAKETKRAIQFGARTAKMETRKTKGTQLVS